MKYQLISRYISYRGWEKLHVAYRHKENTSHDCVIFEVAPHIGIKIHDWIFVDSSFGKHVRNTCITPPCTNGVLAILRRVKKSWGRAGGETCSCTHTKRPAPSNCGTDMAHKQKNTPCSWVVCLTVMTEAMDGQLWKGGSLLNCSCVQIAGYHITENAPFALGKRKKMRNDWVT